MPFRWIISAVAAFLIASSTGYAEDDRVNGIERPPDQTNQNPDLGWLGLAGLLGLFGLMNPERRA